MQTQLKRQIRTTFIAFGAVMALGLAAPAQSAASETDGNWEKLRSEDGIDVSRKEIAGSPFVAFRGEGDVDAPILAVGSVLVDVPHEKDWIDSVVEAKILKEVSETEYIMYSHLGTPPGMSDRDFVTDVMLKLDPAHKGLSVTMRSVNDESGPTTKYVRAELQNSVFSLTSIDGGKKTHVVAEIHCDPKGSIPAFIVNAFQKNWGYNTIASLRKQVAKSPTTHERLKAMMTEKGFFN